MSHDLKGSAKRTFVQRLLRGWALYVGLIMLLVFLYARGLRTLPADLGKLKQHTEHDTLEWWPKELDQSNLRAITKNQPELGLAISVVSFCLAGMAIGGLVFGLRVAWTGRLSAVWRFHAQPIPPWSWGELVRIILLTLIVVGLLPFAHEAFASVSGRAPIEAHLWVTTSMLFLDLFVIFTITAFAEGKRGSALETLGLIPRSIGPAVNVGFQGYLGVFPWIFFLLFVIVQIAHAVGFEPPKEPIQELIFEKGHPAALFVTIVLACVIGPVAEEFLFRGVIFGTIRRYSSGLVAMLVSGALFALVHTNIVGFLPIMVLGCLLSNLYDRTGSLAAPIAVHMLHNTLLMSMALVFRQLTALS